MTFQHPIQTANIITKAKPLDEYNQSKFNVKLKTGKIN